MCINILICDYNFLYIKKHIEKKPKYSIFLVLKKLSEASVLQHVTLRTLRNKRLLSHLRNKHI